MAYDHLLADRIRAYLSAFTPHLVEEKEIFGGLAFLVNGKMCINVSGDRLMCRFDPVRYEELAERPGFEPLIMKGKVMTGYCDVHPVGFRSQRDLAFWMEACLEFNDRAKSSKKKR
jgi:TfoX/Sxy family transcriptional regulator of competence genes